MYIIKANGEREMFNQTKLENSLRQAGTEEDIIRKITKQIVDEIKEGDTTTKIYRKAFSLLNKLQKPVATKYSLRRAIMELGPTGFLFEKFIGKLLEVKGYNVKVGEMINGFCVEHEVDIIAHKGDELLSAELKFHNQPGIKSDLKTTLYVKARFDDLEKNEFYKNIGNFSKRTNGIITNTKFTSKAIKYGECAGLKMMSWNYPRQGNFQQFVDSTMAHPITALTSLSSRDKKVLLQKDIVLCRQIKEGGESLLLKAGIQKSKTERILKEIDILCEHLKNSDKDFIGI
jgi:hypothetical protein